MPSYEKGLTNVTITGKPRTMQRVEGTNEVRFPGMDHNNGRRPLLIVAENLTTVVVKIPGCKYWNGNGSDWANAPAVYITFLKVGDDVLRIIETPVRTSNEVTK